MTEEQVLRFDQLMNEAILLVPEDRLKSRLAEVKYDLKKFLFEQDKNANEHALVSVLPAGLHKLNRLSNDDTR